MHPYINRFLSADTIVPNPMNPQQYNRYTYVLNSPLIHNDPSGHSNQRVLTHEEGGGLPEWWRNGSRVFVEGFGVFDIGHVKRGYGYAEFFQERVLNGISMGGDTFGVRSGTYERLYSISGDVDESQVASIVLGMYMNFEVGYEWHQLTGGNGPMEMLGGYAPEDLPSDYLGAWAFLNGYNMSDILGLMTQDLGKVAQFEGPLHQLDERGGSMQFGRSRLGGITIPRNIEFTPMAPTTVNGITVNGIIKGIEWVNVPWPQEFQMTPITSSPPVWR